MLTIATPVDAVPQRPRLLQREPDRYAFVTGIGFYNDHGSNLKDLLTACDEALQFREQLLALGWRADHIFPLIPANAGGSNPGERVRNTICDLTNAQLADGLKKFSNMLLDDKQNPYGVVYISSHGAQSNGSQYVFGSDARIDFDAELSRAKVAERYKVFADDAVDVLDITSRVSGAEGRAMLIILDACRDNAILDEYKKKLDASGGAIDHDLATRLAAGYLSGEGKIRDVVADFTNMIVLFSTRPLHEAAGAPAGKTTEFSKTVIAALKDERAVQAPAPGFVDEIMAQSRRAQNRLAYYDRQPADRLGSMRLSPIFCFKGCAQPIDVFPTENIRLIGERAPSGGDALAQAEVRRPSAPARVSSRPTFTNVAMTTWTAAAPLPAAAAPAEAGDKPMKIDVFYCLGDDQAAAREQQAADFAHRLRDAFPVTRVIQGRYLKPIRLRSFDPTAQAALARGKVGVSVWIDPGSAAEAAWADRVISLKPDIARRYVRRPTDNYFSIFFCAAPGATPVPASIIYTQVARRVDEVRALAIIDEVATGAPGLTFQRTIDPVDDRLPGSSHMPDQSEVRYFEDNQRASADALAKDLGARLTHPVRAVKIDLGRKPKNPVMEIWFSTAETSGWAAATDPPK